MNKKDYNIAVYIFVETGNVLMSAASTHPSICKTTYCVQDHSKGAG